MHLLTFWTVFSRKALFWNSAELEGLYLPFVYIIDDRLSSKPEAQIIWLRTFLLGANLRRGRSWQGACDSTKGSPSRKDQSPNWKIQTHQSQLPQGSLYIKGQAGELYRRACGHHPRQKFSETLVQAHWGHRGEQTPLQPTCHGQYTSDHHHELPCGLHRLRHRLRRKLVH